METLHQPEGRIFRVLRIGVGQEGRDAILEDTRPGLQLQLEESREDGGSMHTKKRGSCAWWRANVSGDMAVPAPWQWNRVRPAWVRPLAMSRTQNLL